MPIRMKVLTTLLQLLIGAGGCAVGDRDAIRDSLMEVDRDACTVVGPMWGPEDFNADLDPDTGPRLIVSASDRRGDASGGIWEIRLEEDRIGEARLLADRIAGCPLRPHGLFLRDLDAPGPRRLYVVHHGRAGDERIPGCAPPQLDDGEVARHFIAVFSVDTDGLHHIMSLADPELRSPNDVFAADDQHLYVTDEISQRGLLAGALEYLGLRATSRVLLYDGARWRVAADGIRLANGITGAGERLYVTGTFDESIHVYARTPGSGRLEVLNEIKISSAGDNLMFDAERQRLLVTGHGSMPRYIRHRRYPEETSPNEILEIDPSTEPPTITRIWRDDGRVVSNASVSLIHGGALYIGRVHDRGIVRCPLLEGSLPSQ